MRTALLVLGVCVVAFVTASVGSASPAGVFVCVNGTLTATTSDKETGSTPADWIKGAIPAGAQPNADGTGYFTCTLPSGAVRLRTTDGILGTPGFDAFADSEGDMIWFSVPNSTLVYPAYTTG